MDLKYNIALVTGGASGLGRGTVEHFVSRGCKVAILDIKYGLFNVDEWKQIFSNLIAKKMNDFTIANTDEEMIKREIAAFLETTISNFEERYQEQNKGSGFANLLKRSVTSFAGIFDQVRDDIPIFTEEIYTFFTEGNSQEMLKKLY